MPTSNGLSHSTCSLPRNACTMGAFRRSASARTSSCAPSHPEPQNMVTRPSLLRSAASRSTSTCAGTATACLGSRPATLGNGARNYHDRDATIAHRLPDRDLQNAGHLVGPGDQLTIVTAFLE